MKIPIAKLPIGLHELEFEGPASAYKLNSAVFSTPVIGQIQVDKGEAQVYVHALVKTNGLFSCDRCVREFDQEISGELRLCYQIVGTGGRPSFTGEEGDGEAGLRTYRTGEAFIDISDDIRDTLVISVPMKNVCSPECQGICPGCGEDLKESACKCGEKPPDPRWDTLKQLQDKTPEDG